MKKKFVRSVAIGLGMLFVAAISHAATLDIQGGQLYGASNVDVEGVLYDVLFLDGTAIDLYNGANENTDFTFYTGTSFGDPNGTNLARAASQALLDQVFIDEFDSNPQLINGCFTTGGCYVYTPVWVNAGGGMGGLNVRNNAIHEDVILTLSVLNTFDTGWWGGPDGSGAKYDGAVYAVWSEATSVPIPGAVWLFGSGLAGLIGLRRKKK